jgi:hypothetical protein
MNLRDYFKGKSGVGVISTSNDMGEVNSAVYAKPHVNGTDSISFIMRDRLTRANLQTNPQANYLFIEHDHGFHGVRLSLTMTGEEQDEEKIAALSRRPYSGSSKDEERYLVSFKVDRALVLIGGEEIELE